MKIGLSECIQVIGKASWGLNDPNNFFISTTSNEIEGIILCFQGSDSIDIIAMDLCS